MISFPFRRRTRRPTIEALYGTIVAQARSPVFYRDYGVPDTIAGRFEMIVLHLVLLMRELRTAPATESLVGQQVFDRFCQDMDDNFREMGVGDLAVPKEMRRVAEAYYGRAKAYQGALADDAPEALEAALARNVYGVSTSPMGATLLAAYMREASRRIEAAGYEAIVGGGLTWPAPESVPSLQPEESSKRDAASPD